MPRIESGAYINRPRLIARDGRKQTGSWYNIAFSVYYTDKVVPEKVFVLLRSYQLRNWTPSGYVTGHQ